MAKLTANGVTIEGTAEELAVIMVRMTAKVGVVEALSVDDKVRVIGLSIFGNNAIGKVGTIEHIDSDGDYSVVFEKGPQRYYRRDAIELDRN